MASDLNHAHLIVNAHACPRAATYGHILELTLDLSRKLSPKWRGGPIFCSGPFFAKVLFLPIAIMVLKLCTVKVENSGNARSDPFSQIWSHIIIIGN